MKITANTICFIEGELQRYRIIIEQKIPINHLELAEMEAFVKRENFLVPTQTL